MNFYSRGKLLISGEYLVIKGAKALCVPLHQGQSLEISETLGNNTLEWKSLEKGNEWFSGKLSTSLFEILNASDRHIAEKLVNLLRAARKLNPDYLMKGKSYIAVTDLEFSRNWGFGSSSTLISNLAYWAAIDPYKLLSKVSAGSGYDVVVAREDNPVYFTRFGKGYEIEEVDFNPVFRKKLFFIYLGQKQNSSASVNNFLESKKHYRVEKRMITELSQHIANAKTLADFEYYIKEHDLILSALLKTPRLKESRFGDLKGEIKPLGAWGGDFAMMTWNGARDKLKDYLKSKDIDTFFSFDEIVKTK